MARRSKKCTYNGLNFDSLVERDHYKISEERQANGEIFNLRNQVTYTIQDGFRDNGGVKIQAITYSADEVYEDENGVTHIVDVKGSVETIEQTFYIKWKMMKYKYRDFKYHIMVRYDGLWWDVNIAEEKKKLKEYKAEKQRLKAIEKANKPVKKTAARRKRNKL